MSGALDPYFTIKAEFDWLWVACEQANMAKPTTMLRVVAAAEEVLTALLELPL